MFVRSTDTLSSKHRALMSATPCRISRQEPGKAVAKHYTIVSQCSIHTVLSWLLRNSIGQTVSTAASSPQRGIVIHTVFCCPLIALNTKDAVRSSFPASIPVPSRVHVSPAGCVASLTKADLQTPCQSNDQASSVGEEGGKGARARKKRVIRSPRLE